MSQPTPFPELNEVLADLVSRVRGLLGSNFVGAYLQGSFALGAGDAYSDADFVIVVRDDLDDGVIPSLNQMHASIHELQGTWPQHLEGTYFPVDVLRNLALAPTEVPGQPRPPGWTDPQVSGRTATVYPTWFLNNGDARLVRSEHDNSLVVRWILRESGIALAGPPARELIDPVDSIDLRAEIRAVMESFGGALLDGSVVIEQQWLQGFTVLLFARMLCTIETGDIFSKPASVEWALSNLDERWHGLVERAWSMRTLQARGIGAPLHNETTPADPADVAATLAFVRFAMDAANAR